MHPSIFSVHGHLLTTVGAYKDEYSDAVLFGLSFRVYLGGRGGWVDGFAFIIAYSALITPVSSWWLLIHFPPLNNRKKAKTTKTKTNRTKSNPWRLTNTQDSKMVPSQNQQILVRSPLLFLNCPISRIWLSYVYETNPLVYFWFLCF